MPPQKKPPPPVSPEEKQDRMRRPTAAAIAGDKAYEEEWNRIFHPEKSNQPNQPDQK